MYTGNEDEWHIERGPGGDLDLPTMTWLPARLMEDEVTPDLTVPPLSCLPQYMDRELRARMQKVMPKLGHYTLAPRDIPEEELLRSSASTDASVSASGALTNLGKAPCAGSSRGGSSKEKEKVTSPGPLLRWWGGPDPDQGT
jgi:hypothetical protein